MRELKPTEMAHHANPPVQVPKSLETTTHVFVRTDAVRQPLVRPYTGPYRVVSKSAKYFVIEKNGKTDSVTVDRLKPAFTHQESDSPITKTDDVTKDEAGNSNPISVESEAPPEPRKKRGRPKKSYSEAVQTQMTAPVINTKSIPLTKTRSGRVF